MNNFCVEECIHFTNELNNLIGRKSGVACGAKADVDVRPIILKV